MVCGTPRDYPSRGGRARGSTGSSAPRSVERMSNDGTTKPTEVDPETKTDAEGKPVENPSG